jgi:hypothetical protein
LQLAPKLFFRLGVALEHVLLLAVVRLAGEF